jgi:LmbE family N-acetylglucosaminyl deacetylase
MAKSLLHNFFMACGRDLDLAARPGPVQVIAPHPDDESLGCGATIARLRSLGQRVRIIIVTDGSACGSSTVLAPQDIAAIRRRESLDAAKALGVTPEDVAFLDFPDNGTRDRASAVEAALDEEIRMTAPRLIFSPYGVDAHPDHQVTAAAIDRLHKKGVILCSVFEYPVWFWTPPPIGHLLQPRKLMRLRRVPTAGFLDAKKAAVAAHRSQHVALTNEPGWFILSDRFLEHFFLRFEIFFEK